MYMLITHTHTHTLLWKMKVHKHIPQYITGCLLKRFHCYARQSARGTEHNIFPYANLT